MDFSFISIMNNTPLNKRISRTNKIIKKVDKLSNSMDSRISNKSIDSVSKSFLNDDNKSKYLLKGLIYNKIFQNGSMKNLHKLILKQNLIYQHPLDKSYNSHYSFYKKKNNSIDSIKKYMNNKKNFSFKNNYNISCYKIKINKPPYFNQNSKSKRAIDEFIKFSPIKKYSNSIKKSLNINYMSNKPLKYEQNLFKNVINLKNSEFKKKY